MGNVLSGGKDNEELVDILRVLRYIQTKNVELVFRAVDRGNYVQPCHCNEAYRDVSWKIGNIHLSAPCVYAKVMEGLSLESGMSFLNIGSGTGYLSTMAGLILGHHGTNHGIELHKDCLQYSYERLDDFKQTSLALDGFNFCEPVFVNGNILRAVPNRQYDRVYCGAACSKSQEPFIKQFVKVGGILVMPNRDFLLKIERVSADTWRRKEMLPVAFASLVNPADEDHTEIQLPFPEPLSLQELCRFKICECLRRIIMKENPGLATKVLITKNVKDSTPNPLIPLSNYVQSLYEGSDYRDSSDEEEERRPLPNNSRYLVCVNANSENTQDMVDGMAPSTQATGNRLNFQADSSDSESGGKKTSVSPMKSSSLSSNTSSSLSSPSSSSKEDDEKESPGTAKNWKLENNSKPDAEPMVVDETPSKDHEQDCQVSPKALCSNYAKDESFLSAAEYFQCSKASDNPNIIKNSRLTAQADNYDKNNHYKFHNDSSSSTSTDKSSRNHSSEMSSTNYFDEMSFTNEKSENLCDSSTTSSNGKRDIGENVKIQNKKQGEVDGEADGDVSEETEGEGETQSQPKKKRGRRLWNTEEELLNGACSHWSDPKSESSSSNESRRIPNSNHRRSGIPCRVWDSVFSFDVPMSGNEGFYFQYTDSDVISDDRPPRVFARSMRLNELSTHMKLRILQLPLPTALQLYINYNRSLE